MKPELLKRVVVGVVGGAVLIGVTFVEAKWAAGLFTILAVVGIGESLKLLHEKTMNLLRIFSPWNPNRPLTEIVWLLPLWLGFVAPKSSFLLASLTALLLLGLHFRFLLNIFWLSQVVCGFYSAYLLRSDLGSSALLTLFLVTWSADSFAYFAGMKFGKTPFAPTISPKKTWEGYWGGLAGAVAVGAICGFVTGFPLRYALFGLVAGAVGPFGDLAESALKREAGVKDSGAWLPGHGGILDRFDAFIVNAPLCLMIGFWA